MPACNDIAFGLLCELIEAPHADIHPDTVRCSGRREAYEHLHELQALQVGTGLAGSVLCPWCGDDELCSLSFSEEGYRGYCSDCGWLNLATHQVKPLRVEYQRIVRWIASALGLQGRFRLEERVPARLWRLGDIEHRRKRRTVFFGRRLNESSDAQTIDAGIRAVAAPGTEILITTTPQDSIAPPLANGRLVPLRAVSHLRKAGFVVENLESYLDAPLIADEDVAETSLRLLRSGRLALIDGKQIKVSPQIYRFLSILIDADGKPVHKRVLADALEMDVDACKGSEIFKRHKAVYRTFIEHDTEGRYWLKPEFLSRRGGE
ncbi:hypothetical protein [Methylococcus mesophilus]|uniref:hypothetical protein n=1 Tax=Methylococcus mesophilus TaxID=2993564 RepID=UPI00224AF7B2|nr:hypothetical protein [Methylococcus mesophilus]UZR28122.1 hypothetical protein OOT43_15590 [Methylococcus mesophilus]